MTNSLTTQETYGIIQPSNRERRDMDIRDVANEISNITGAIDDAMNEAEEKEGQIQERVENLERIKNELEAGRSQLDEVMNILSDFNATRLTDALDEADDLGIN
jgi:predicted  nucleic acid-binding Zn-ribbon protein